MSTLLVAGAMLAGLTYFIRKERSGGWADREERRKFLEERDNWKNGYMEFL